MKGNEKVLEQLNRALREELTAINQYFVHAEMDEDWGYDRLAHSMKKISIEEMKHAETLIERILFLDGSPHMEPMALTIGKNVKEALGFDLKLEHDAVVLYNEAARIATENGDHGSRDLFVKAAEGRREARGLAGSPVARDRRDGLRALSVHAEQRREVKRTEVPPDEARAGAGAYSCAPARAAHLSRGASSAARPCFAPASSWSGCPLRPSPRRQSRGRCRCSSTTSRARSFR